MDTKVVNKIPARGTNPVLVISIAIDATSSTEASLPKTTLKAIEKCLKRGDLANQPNKTVVLHDLPDIGIARVVLHRAGPSRADRPASTAKAFAKSICTALKDSPCEQIMVLFNDVNCPSTLPIQHGAQLIAATITSEQYQFTAHPRTEKQTPSAVKSITFIVEKSHTAKVKAAVSEGVAIATGMALTKDLGNLAPNLCTPNYLATEARKLAKNDKAMKVTVVDEAKMEKLGMGAFLSVSRGSRQPAKLIAMEYSGGKKGQKPLVLVGKGVTFDTGGISIKPSAGMDEMKFDMCGAATVFGVMKACQAIGLKLNVVGVVAAAENMPDGDASRPGDVVTTLSGQSVEILNTDAEGRLVLCDTLTWVEKYKPKAVVDMATLTGACIVALGNVCSAVLGNDDELVDELYEAGQAVDDTTWPLPMWDDYQPQLDSNFADMANIGGKGAGTITAACFLSRFAENYPWAHLDIAGIAWNSGADKGATGRPVPMLMHWLLSQTR